MARTEALPKQLHVPHGQGDVRKVVAGFVVKLCRLHDVPGCFRDLRLVIEVLGADFVPDELEWGRVSGTTTHGHAQPHTPQQPHTHTQLSGEPRLPTNAHLLNFVALDDVVLVRVQLLKQIRLLHRDLLHLWRWVRRITGRQVERRVGARLKATAPPLLLLLLHPLAATCVGGGAFHGLGLGLRSRSTH